MERVDHGKAAMDAIDKGLATVAMQGHLATEVRLGKLTIKDAEDRLADFERTFVPGEPDDPLATPLYGPPVPEDLSILDQ